MIKIFDNNHFECLPYLLHLCALYCETAVLVAWNLHPYVAQTHKTVFLYIKGSCACTWNYRICARHRAYINPYMYFVYARRECSDEPARVRRLAKALVARQCGNYKKKS